MGIWGTCAHAQPLLETPTTATAEQDVPPVRELPFEFHLRQADGKTILVPGFSLDEYLRLYRQANDLESSAGPAFEMKRMSVSGEVVGQVARLDVALEIERLDIESVPADQWIAVPLRMSQAVLRDLPTYEGPGKQFLRFEQQGGMVWRLQAEPGTQHKLNLQVSLNISQLANETRLLLEAPFALVSQVELDVNDSNVVGNVTDAATQTTRRMDSRPLAGQKTRLSAAGLRGDVMISWGRSNRRNRLPRSLDVDGNIRVTIDNPRQIRSEAQLTVRGFGGAFSAFRVRLPAGMVWREGQDPALEETLIEADVARGQLVEVKLRGRRAPVREMRARIVAEWLAGREIDGDAVKACDFVVEGALRQRGTVDCEVIGDWTLSAIEGPNVTRIDEAPQSPLRLGSGARFNYFTQPCELALSVRPRESRLRVEPAYDIDVRDDHLQLTATLQFRLSGARPLPFRLQLPGWTVTNVLQDDTPITNLNLNQTTPLSIPFPDDVAATSAVTTKVIARMPISEAVRTMQEPLRVVLPQPQTDGPGNRFVAPAAITVRSDSNVEVTPLSELLENLIARAAPPAVGIERESPALHYRDRGTSEPAVFVSAFRTYSRQITVDRAATVQIGVRTIDVTQFLGYRVRYEPINQLQMLVPEQLIVGDQLAVKFYVRDEIGARGPIADEQALNVLVQEPGDEDPVGLRRVLVNLRESRLGSFLILSQFSQNSPTLDPGQSLVHSLSLVAPAMIDTVDPAIANRIAVQFAEPMRVEAIDENWSVSELTSSTNELQLSNEGDQSTISLQLQLNPQQQSTDVIVNRVWIQTWLTHQIRRDRLALSLTSNRPMMRMQLPEGAVITDDAIDIAVDGQRVLERTISDSRELSFRLAEEDLGRPLVVELWYRFNQRPASGSLMLSAPVIDATLRTDRTYWQIVTPSNEHLAWVTSDVTPELKWSTKNGLILRQSSLAQHELESWVGAGHQDALPSQTNQYVFTSFGVPPELEVITLTRAQLLLGASGAVLLLGLALIHLSWMRHPTWLLVIGVAILAGSILAPDLAVVFVQAGLLGAVLVAFSKIVEWVLTRRRGIPRPQVVANRDSRSLEVALPNDSRVTTISSPVERPASMSESNS